MSQQTPVPESEIEILIEQAAKELQIDQLKKELIANIRKDKSQKSFSAMAAHPATLVIIGFLFTGIFGTLITSRWQSWEWDRQQARLLQIRRIEQKEKIMESLTRIVDENCATTEDVLIAFDNSWRVGESDREEITKERIKTWRTKGGPEWRVTRELLKANLSFYFTEKEVQDKLLKSFETIFGEQGTREQITVKMGGLVTQYLRDGNKVRDDENFQDAAGECSELIKSQRKELQSMDQLILQDIEKHAAVPHTILDYVM
jgi:hypothetical protein